jgi:predicted amino acid dehydrogenase
LQSNRTIDFWRTIELALLDNFKAQAFRVEPERFFKIADAQGDMVYSYYHVVCLHPLFLESYREL